jgi:hypothetical protein
LEVRMMGAKELEESDRLQVGCICTPRSTFNKLALGRR